MNQILHFFTCWYRFKINWYRYGRTRDLAQFVMAIATGVLAINTYSVKPQITIVAGGIYILVLILIAIKRFKLRETQDNVQAQVLWGLFSHMNKEIFKDDPHTRFTLFIESPVSPKSYIVPWYRYHKGASNPVNEAKGSRARYARGEGITGQAWDKVGDLLFSTFPVFNSRSEFESYYIDKMKVDGNTVRELSQYMERVQTIFTYGFTDFRGKLLGVLSLDLPKPIYTLEDGDGNTRLFANDIEIDARAMALILGSIRNVLESFDTISRR